MDDLAPIVGTDAAVALAPAIAVETQDTQTKGWEAVFLKPEKVIDSRSMDLFSVHSTTAIYVVKREESEITFSATLTDWPTVMLHHKNLGALPGGSPFQSSACRHFWFCPVLTRPAAEFFLADSLSPFSSGHSVSSDNVLPNGGVGAGIALSPPAIKLLTSKPFLELADSPAMGDPLLFISHVSHFSRAYHEGRVK